MLAEALDADGDRCTVLPSCPAACQLLQSPELLPCLAIVLVVSVLELDTVADGGAGPAGAIGSSSRGSGSSAGGQPAGSNGQQQPQWAGSSSGSEDGSNRSGSSSARLQDSLTPLSCGLFDILGVSKETMLQAARLAAVEQATTSGSIALIAAYTSVVTYQVS